MSDSDPVVGNSRGTATTGEHTSQNASNSKDSPTAQAWEEKALLSLDGGGIRGYWTLLALETLVDHIAEIEMGEDEQMRLEPVQSSFHPEDLPDYVSHLPSTGIDELKLRRRKFLLCHYFDLIIGSSTGALIALMLGRFRMTVPDCLHEYRTLGDAVFGHPRLIWQQNFPICRRHRYKAFRLEQVMRDVAERRAEEISTGGEPLLPLAGGVCQVCVTSLRLRMDNQSVANPYLLRTYDGSSRRKYVNPTSRASTWAHGAANGGPPPKPLARETTMRNTKHGETLNLDKAQRLPIWQVARAATAAKTYFKPIEIKIRDGEEERSLFEDGGFGINNPSVRGKEEIERTMGRKRLKVAVSVGTARKQKPGGDRSTRRLISNLADRVTNVEDSHNEMMNARKEDRDDFEYWRFNAEGEYALDINLDEWEPKGTRDWKMKPRRSGSKTIQTIERQYKDWIDTRGTRQYFRECARELVQRRRNRSHPDYQSRWETYSTATHFECSLEGCTENRGPVRRDTFKVHLKSNHGNVPHHDIERVTTEHKKCWEYRRP